jgi:hypothetical protein
MFWDSISRSIAPIASSADLSNEVGNRTPEYNIAVKNSKKFILRREADSNAGNNNAKRDSDSEAAIKHRIYLKGKSKGN